MDIMGVQKILSETFSCALCALIRLLAKFMCGYIFFATQHTDRFFYSNQLAYYVLLYILKVVIVALQSKWCHKKFRENLKIVVSRGS